jgi:uncharacterized membrane protein
MKLTAVIGSLLILLGIAFLAIGRFEYSTNEKVAALGPLTATVSEQHSIRLPDIAGFGIIVAGGLVLLLSRRRT